MSTERTLALVFALALPATASAQSAPKPPAPSASDPCDTNRQIDLKVPLFKQPCEVEGYNKIRLTLLPIRDEAAQTLTLEVRGTAYYPDDVVLIVGVRHAKLGMRDYFKKDAKVLVKDRAFSVKFGPFKKVIPGGGIAVDACFLLSSQSEKVKKTLLDDKWFHCSPPCSHDQVSVGHIQWSNGGYDSQVEAEKAEKEQIANVREQLLAAQKACDESIDSVAAKKADPSVAANALVKLEGDLKAAAESFNAWRATREFALFGTRIAQLRSLSAHIRECERAAAADAGASVPDLDTAKAKDLAAKERALVKQVAGELKGFLDEPDSLDRAWNALGAELFQRYVEKSDAAKGEKCDPSAQPPKK